MHCFSAHSVCLHLSLNQLLRLTRTLVLGISLMLCDFHQCQRATSYHYRYQAAHWKYTGLTQLFCSPWVRQCHKHIISNPHIKCNQWARRATNIRASYRSTIQRHPFLHHGAALRQMKQQCKVIQQVVKITWIHTHRGNPEDIIPPPFFKPFFDSKPANFIAYHPLRR